MRISVNNFKAIKELENFELSNIIIMSGTNSGGKTSVIQLLMLIKQTLESNDAKIPLKMNKPYVWLGSFKDIVYKRNISNKLHISFDFDKKDLDRLSIRSVLKKMTKQDLKSMTFSLTFASTTTRVYIDALEIRYRFNDNDLWFSLDRIRSFKYNITTNSVLFLYQQYRDTFVNRLESDFADSSSQHYEWESKVSFDRFFPRGFDVQDEYDVQFSPLANNIIDRILNLFFENMSYLGPLRDEPHSYYINEDDYQINIGNKGEFAAHILAKSAKDVITNYRIVTNKENNTISYMRDYANLENSVKYWICDIFDMATDLKVGKYDSGAMYKIEVTNHYGIKTPITHVGFGISQILPIVVEGLRLKGGSTLILEQPEIHLHPKVQSLLFDFLFSLTLSGKRIIIETHSDHFITRLRRRVAEDQSGIIKSQINLSFIERENDHNKYTILNMSDTGTFSYWPKDFFDQLDHDFRAIVKAQGLKRRNMQGKGGNE